jgi:cleavage and polyadenylation specificity factor subunit 1
MPKYDEESSLRKPAPLRALSNIGGYSTVFMAGGSPSFVVKDATTLPRIVSLRGKSVRALCGINSRKCQAGIAWVDVTVSLSHAPFPV